MMPWHETAETLRTQRRNIHISMASSQIIARTMVMTVGMAAMRTYSTKEMG